ncbi:MAG: hypothetical protein QW385_03300 [Thermoproteota archaeon]
MKRLRSILLILAFSTLLFNLNQIPVSPATFELSHDDGGFDYGWSDFYPSGAMVRFSPPSPSWRIKSVRVHGVCSLRGSGSFYIQVCDSNLNTKYSASFSFNEVFKNNVLDWYTVEIPNVVVTGEFYVVIIPMFTLDGSQLWISVDNDPPIANSSLIVNTDTHETLASMNATSNRPGDFMVRVVGEPTAMSSELRLSSIEFNENETIVAFTYPGEIMSVGARLVEWDGGFIEENVTRNGQSLIVRIKDQGTLNVFVVTPDSEIVGTSVRIETGLRSLYRRLLANYTILKANADEMGRWLNSLAEENERLRIAVRDSGYAIGTLQNQVWGLMENVTQQERQIAELNGSVERLRFENMVLIILLIMAIAVSIIILTFKRLRMRK